MALTWMEEEEKERDRVCVFSGHGRRDELSRGGGEGRKMDTDR